MFNKFAAIIIALFFAYPIYAVKFDQVKAFGFKIGDTKNSVLQVLNSKSIKYKEKNNMDGGKYFLIEEEPLIKFLDYNPEDIRIVFDKSRLKTISFSFKENTVNLTDLEDFIDSANSCLSIDVGYALEFDNCTIYLGDENNDSDIEIIHIVRKK